MLSIFNDMYEGKMNGFFCQGFNPLASLANKKKVATRWPS
jgi:anaerobic selenocysteine-containing dehydrogenase